MRFYQIFITFLLLFIGFSLSAKTTTIQLRMANGAGQEVICMPTLDGTFFTGSAIRETINESGEVVFSFDTAQEGLCYLTFSDWSWPGTGSNIPVIVAPGGRVRIALDRNDPIASLRISGPYSAENRYLATTRRPEISFSYMKKFWLDEPNAAILGRKLEIAMKKEWVKLNTGGLKTSPVLPFLEADLYWYYINIMQGLYIYHRRVHESTLINWEPIFITLLAEQPEVSYSVSSQWFSRAALSYAEGYQQQWYKLAKALPDEQEVGLLEILESIPELHWREAALARHLHQNYQVIPYPTLRKQYQYFTQMWPNSKRLPALKSALTPYLEFMSTYNPNDSTGLILEEPASWQEFIRAYRGKIILVDLWASWCEQCEEQFAAYADIKKLLQKYPDDLEVLFVSLDAPEDRADWHRDIHFHHLTFGQHILATGDLLVQIEDRMAERYAVPNYLIVDRQGQLLTNRGPLPVEADKLEKILEGLIKL